MKKILAAKLTLSVPLAQLAFFGPWVVHESLGEPTWSITHVRTGIRATHFRRREHALGAAKDMRRYGRGIRGMSVELRTKRSIELVLARWRALDNPTEAAQ